MLHEGPEALPLVMTPEEVLMAKLILEHPEAVDQEEVLMAIRPPREMKDLVRKERPLAQEIKYWV